MPKNKDALIRYRVINRCFRERTFVTLQDLKEACERTLDIYPIGDRTIQADINAMRYDGRLGYNAPIKIDRTRGVYYYEDPNYSIDNIPLNEDEMESLVFASRLLEQYSDVEIFRGHSPDLSVSWLIRLMYTGLMMKTLSGISSSLKQQ